MPSRRFAKAADLEAFHGERLHDAHPTDGLLQDRGHVGHAFLRTMRRAPKAQSEVDDRINQERRDDKADQRQLGVGDEDVEQKTDQRDRFLKQIAHPRGDRGLNGVGIRHQPADHLTGRAFGKEAMALIDDPFIQLVAQIAHGRQPDFLKAILGEE